ncbi:hypothetical protein K505DRAFT_325632 [Melanomma pulvis-pyrius CBS 109.77]|uniref:F-box domain-containing protein n=1 Tax=Melanomma pulvis-pyrius CBS 109.77 TaxID=1314802 RepID=A0A6A6XAI7_9PLEO|nr:hypothetical protein K505DRAFT_325632 [Melanomma pulvis-pyrius CBS 109.77]
MVKIKFPRSRRRGNDSLLPPLPLPPLLNLPIELFLHIWDTLPLHSRASLALTCRSLYAAYGAPVVKQLNLDSLHSRTYRLYLLRLIRKDLKEPSLWLCYGCMKLHARSPTRHGRNFMGYIAIDAGQKRELPPGPGFPCCNSAFTLARDYVQSLLNTSQDCRPTIYSERCKGELTFTYNIRLDVGFQGLCMSTVYIYSLSFLDRTQRRVHNDYSFSPHQLADFLRSTNTEFCEHLWLGHDYVPGDGSMSANLEAAYTGYSGSYQSELSGFECRECHIEVKFRVVFATQLEVIVWQYFRPGMLEPGVRPARLNRWDTGYVVREYVEGNGRRWWERWWEAWERF